MTNAADFNPLSQAGIDALGVLTLTRLTSMKRSLAIAGGVPAYLVVNDQGCTDLSGRDFDGGCFVRREGVSDAEGRGAGYVGQVWGLCVYLRADWPCRATMYPASEVPQ